MQQNQIKALIKLIHNGEGAIEPQLKSELARLIKTQPAALRSVLKEEFNGAVPAAVSDLVEEVAWERLKKSFQNFNAKINPDLEEGLLLLSQFEKPAPLKNAFYSKLDALTAQVRARIINCADMLEAAESLQLFFFENLSVKVQKNTFDRAHFSFDDFLHTRRGSGLCAACLYYITGLRYGMEINIVDVAGRILVKFEDPSFNAPFYADPFDKGKLLARRDCMDFAAARGLEWKEEYEKPLPARAVIKRFLSNMIYVNKKLNDGRRLVFLREYISYFE